MVAKEGFDNCHRINFEEANGALTGNRVTDSFLHCLAKILIVNVWLTDEA